MTDRDDDDRRETGPTTSGGVVVSQAICAFARHAVDQGRGDLLDRYGVPHAARHERYVSVPRSLLETFPHALAAELRRNNLGLELGSAAPEGVSGALEYVVRAAPTMRAAYKRFMRYLRLSGLGAEWAFDEVGGAARMRHHIPGVSADACRHVHEYVVAVAVRMMRLIAGPRLPISSIGFAHAAPPQVGAHEAYFQAPLTFGLRENHVSVALVALDLSPVRGDTADAMQRALGTMPELIEVPDAWTSAVRNLVARALHDGAPSLEEVAKLMGTSPRTLQRRLQEQGTSFLELMDGVRRELAAAWMRDTTRSVTEIAFLLGFSELSAYTRAFKRWTGTSPRAARQRA